MFTLLRLCLMKNKKGDLEWDEIGKFVLYILLLIVAITIIFVIKGNLTSEGDKVTAGIGGILS